MSRTSGTRRRSLQEPGDGPGGRSCSIESDDDFWKLRGGVPPVGQDLGIECAFSPPENPQVLRRPNGGEEVVGIVPVGLGGASPGTRP
ncbi:MAG: hypothetical protein QXI12_10985 [Candidatus Methanomethyliaceae archaeon]